MGFAHHEETKKARLRLAHRLKLAAARKGLTIQQVAKELQVAPGTIRRYFLGQCGPINDDVIERVQTAISVWNSETRDQSVKENGPVPVARYGGHEVHQTDIGVIAKLPTPPATPASDYIPAQRKG